jgi:hypothetical protein
MGKRELLIITAFVVIGTAAYQLTAEPPAEGRRRFSLANFMDRFREETSGRRASASVTTEGTIALSPGVTEARISSVARVTIRGEGRTDISYALTVEANGPDEDTARQNAARTTLSQDEIGSVLALRANAPREGRQVISLNIAVPAKLLVRVEGTQGGTSLDASNLQSLQLDTVGDVQLHHINGSIGGSHRNGRIAISDSGAIDLTLQNSEAVLERTSGVARLATRNGHIRISGATGEVELTMQNDEVTIAQSAAPVRVTGSGGSLAIDDPRDTVHVDTRRTAIDVRLARGVPLTILTTEEQLRLQLSGNPSIAIDAIATDGGTISAEALGVVPETVNEETRVRHPVNSGSVPVALRNRRGTIVIGEMK